MECLKLFHILGRSQTGENPPGSNHFKNQSRLRSSSQITQLLGNWRENETFSCITKALNLCICESIVGSLCFNLRQKVALLAFCKTTKLQPAAAWQRYACPPVKGEGLRPRVFSPAGRQRVLFGHLLSPLLHVVVTAVKNIPSLSVIRDYPRNSFKTWCPRGRFHGQKIFFSVQCSWPE